MTDVRNSTADRAVLPDAPHEPDAIPGRERPRRGPWSPGIFTLSVLAILVVLLGAGTAYGLALRQRPVYGAEAQILYGITQGASARADRELATQEVIMLGAANLQPVADEQGLSVSALQDAVTVEVIGDSDVLRLQVADPDPSAALRTAELIAEGYVGSVTASSSSELADARAVFENRIEQLSEQLAAVEGRLEELDAQRPADAGSAQTPEERRLDLQSRALQQRLGDLQDQLTSVELEQAKTADVRILAAPELLGEPLAPKPAQAAAAGALVGIAIATAMIVLLTRGRRPESAWDR